ncbi:hypothetical protein Pcinc_040706 [Petrolisthes cinctipes]|uniref:Uncharacterized protein n=1 Tax=Petrolisthes cinctipes TaxID=88211 RepID=A0AAE1EHR9_PETCI|nr:hypothetical protein Pcinc_040706 [Petrolisthes cinctipes]
MHKDDAGHRYLQNVVRNSKVHLQCIQHPRCKGRAVCSELAGVIREIQLLNHEADDCIATDLKNVLKRKAAEQVGSTSN